MADYISSCHGTLQIHLCKIRNSRGSSIWQWSTIRLSRIPEILPRLLFHSSYLSYPIILKEKRWSRKGCLDNEKSPEEVHWPLNYPSQLPYNSASTWLHSGRTDDQPKTQKLCAYNPESTYSHQTRSRRIQEEGWTLQKSAEVLPWSSTPSKRSPTTSKRTTCVGEDSDKQRSSGDWKRFTSVCCYSDWQRYSTQKPQSASPKKWEPDISSNDNAKSVFNTSDAEAGDSRWSKIWKACWRKGNHNSPSTSWGARKPTTWQHAWWTDWSKDCVHKIRTEKVQAP